MLAYAAVLFLLTMADAAGTEAPPVPLAAALDLPLPAVLPCRRFETVEIQVGKDVDSVSGDPNAVATWRAAERDWSFVADHWRQPPKPLPAAALPTRVRLSVPTPVSAALLTFFCRRYEWTERGLLEHDADPFMGVRWLCTSSGCVATAGYALPKDLATSPRRLRLCTKDPARNWDEDWIGFRRCRDVAPTVEDRDKSLALAAEILADARRTLADACQVPDTCTPRARALMASLRPARWRPTSFGGTPAGMNLGAETEGRKLALDCRADPHGDAYCELTLVDGDGRPILQYFPINSPFSSAVAILTLADHGQVWMTAAAGYLQDKTRAACSVSGTLLATRRR
jgi:hypothetical protein